MRPFFNWRQGRRAPVRRARARLAVESLEDRRQPATIVAPDLLSQCDTGASAFDNMTHDAQPMFAGTTTSTTSAQISLVIDNVTVASAAVKRAGGSSFTLQPATPLAEGSHVARFYDSQTKALSIALSFTVDVTSPSAPAAPTLVQSDDPEHLVFQMSGTAGDRLHLKIAGREALATLATGKLQSVSVDVTSMALDPFAPFEVRVVAEDAAGNLSAASDSLSVTLKSESPPPPSDLNLDPASDTGVYDDDGITSETAPSFSGTAVPGQTITLFVDGSAGQSQLVGADGAFKLTAGPLAAGSHQAWVVAAIGNGAPGNASSPVAVTIDLTLPVVSEIALAPSDLSPNDDGVHDTAAFRFTLSETSFVAVYFLDSDEANLGSIPLGLLDSGLQEFDLDVPEFPEGNYTIVVIASDLADNVGDFAKAPFSIDLTPPTPPTFALATGQDTGASATDRITNLASPQFAGVSEPGAKVELREGTTILNSTTAAADGSWTMDIALDEGDHDLTVVAWDNAGNGASSSSSTITVDKTPPSVNAGADQTGMQGTPVTLTAQLSDRQPDTDESWSLISSSNGQSVPAAAGPTLNFTPAKAGVYVFRHAATDAAGNVGEDTITLTVQDAVPALHVAWPSAADVGATFVVHLGFTDPGNDPLDGWSIAWGDGAHDDVAGAATSATHVYTTPGSYTPIVQALQGTLTLTAPGVAVSVQANEAPTLTKLTANAPDTVEDATNPDGVAIKALAESLGIVDSPGSLLGLAITSADAMHGAWQYALDGATWSTLGAVSDSLARLLAADETTRIRFVPAANWSGVANLTVYAWDQSDGRDNGVQASVVATSVSSQAATVAFTVTAVNDAPVLSLPASLAAYRNTDKIIGPAFSVADAEATHLRMTLTIDEGVIVISSNQGLTIATGSGTPNLTIDGPIDILNARLAALIYRPAAGYLGPVTIAISINDLGSGGGAKVATGTLAFDVVNRPPQSVKSPSFSMNANTSLDVAAPGLAGAFVDLDGDAFTIALASPPPVGAIVVSPDGSFRYTPPPGYVGSVSFAVQASDGIDTSAPLWLTIQVKSVYGLRR